MIALDQLTDEQFERHALDVLPRVEGRASRLRGAEVERARDPGVAKGGDGTELGLHPPARRRRGLLGAEDLQGDEARRRGIVRQVDRAHASGAELAPDRVPAGEDAAL